MPALAVTLRLLTRMYAATVQRPSKFRFAKCRAGKREKHHSEILFLVFAKQL
jgi:hypothetical protein